MSKTNTPAVMKASKNVAKNVAPLLLKAPAAAVTPFSAFVAHQQKAIAIAETPKAAKIVKSEGKSEGKEPFVRAEQNGRKNYGPGTIGRSIWDAADKLTEMVPNVPVTAKAILMALPEVTPRSASAGLSHWRQFHGTLKAKAAVVAVALVATAAVASAAVLVVA